MDITKLINEKKTLIIEILIFIGVLVGGYYGYTSFFKEDSVTTVTIDQSLLGSNFIQFMQATKDSKISFKDRTFLSGNYVKQLQDFSEIISPNATRGRLDPFLPYASTRPLR